MPRDLVESHWTKKSILKPSLAATWYTDLTKHIQPTNTFSLRTYLRYLRESMDRDNQQGEFFKNGHLHQTGRSTEMTDKMKLAVFM